MQAVNDNFMCSEWEAFINNKELYSWVVSKGWSKTLDHLKHKNHEKRCMVNFLWFFKFEKSFAEREIEEKRKGIKCIN